MTETIKAKVQEEMKTAMKARDKERLEAIRLILADFKRIEVDERIVLDQARELEILDKMLKQRRDSFAQFTAAGRGELAAKEQFEMDVIHTFMPVPLSEAEIHQLITDALRESSAATPQEMGKVMALLKPKLQGRADIAQVSAKVKAQLAQK